MKFPKAALFAGVPLLLLTAACSDPGPKTQTATTTTTTPAAPAASADQPIVTTDASAISPATQVVPGSDTPPASSNDPLISPSDSPLAKPIDTAAWKAAPETPEARKHALLRAEVLLARAHFSPGVIDGQDGGNLRNAIAAFETAHGQPADGKMDDAVWGALAQDTQPVLTDYVITADDVKGPFLDKIPTDMTELAKLPAVGFTSPLEALAERFHMDEALLKSLNPGADFSAAGTKIVVAALGADKLKSPVARMEVDKTKRQIRAYDAGDVLLAVYPATVGSSERPAPVGDRAVRNVASSPTYTYDPSRLTFGKTEQGKLVIKAGPNNPVGSTWIGLTEDTYGIHGTPDPRLVGKTASHGCVRLTNWDVRQLSQAVKPGAKVAFVGVEQAKAPKAAG